MPPPSPVRCRRASSNHSEFSPYIFVRRRCAGFVSSGYARHYRDDPRVRKAPAKKYCPRKPSASAWVLPLAGLAPTPRAPRRARSPTVPRPAAVSRLCDRATPTHHRAGRRARRALRTPRAGARTITICGSSPRSERSAPTRSRIGSASAGPAQRSWSSCLAERLAGRQAQQDGARAGVMPARDPAWPTIPSGGGLPTPPPPSPPAAAVWWSMGLPHTRARAHTHRRS